MIFLNTLEISNLKSLKHAKDFEEIVCLMRPDENVLLKSSYVYDMTHYYNEKKKLQFTTSDQSNSEANKISQEK